jgi:hypothetical protein
MNDRHIRTKRLAPTISIDREQAKKATGSRQKTPPVEQLGAPRKSHKHDDFC